MPASLLIPTPRSVSDADADAGAVWMQFLTAWGAFRDLTRLSPGQFAVIIAASSSTELAAIQVARDAGAAHVIDIRVENYLSRVREITAGQGVDCVFDPVAVSPRLPARQEHHPTGLHPFAFASRPSRPQSVRRPHHLLPRRRRPQESNQQVGKIVIEK